MITKADREKYRYHTDDAIRGIKLMESLTDKQLLSIWKYKTKSAYFKKVFDIMGHKTNPIWITQEAGCELVNRGLLDYVEPA